MFTKAEFIYECMNEFISMNSEVLEFIDMNS